MVENSKIARFKIVSRYKKKYIVDMDTYKIAWLFPIFSWYLKNNVIEITKKEYELLRNTGKGNHKVSGISIAGISLGGALYKVISTMNNKENMTFLEMLTLLLVAYFIVFIVRDRISELDNEKLKKILGKDELIFNGSIFVNKKSSFKIKNKYRNECILRTCVRIFLTVVFISELFRSNNWRIVIIIFIYESIRLSKVSLVDPYPEIKLEYRKK